MKPNNSTTKPKAKRSGAGDGTIPPDIQTSPTKKTRTLHHYMKHPTLNDTKMTPADQVEFETSHMVSPDSRAAYVRRDNTKNPLIFSDEPQNTTTMPMERAVHFLDVILKMFRSNLIKL